AGLAALALAVAGAGAQAPSGPAPGDLAGIPAADAAAAAASEGWLRLTRRPVPALRSLGGAHPGAKSIRVNRGRAALTGPRGRQRFPYPRGTVIVKTATRNGALSLVAIMRKARAGSAPSSWRYVEYTRSRSGEGFTKVGGGQALCRGCHVSAVDVQRSDWVFTRLAPAP
ncbi:MAG TPA: hypothetical protein VK904_08110, partial [Miltoncostaeaceae bacterium]|nr:hypothetical protein [Miltoncostaeaceae bacterium]